MADVTHFAFKKKCWYYVWDFYYAWINAKLAKILEFVLIGGSDIVKSLIYINKYANYAN